MAAQGQDADQRLRQAVVMSSDHSVAVNVFYFVCG